MIERAVRLGDIAEINPATPPGISAAERVAFVPMASVSEAGSMRVAEHRIAGDLKGGYSYFRSGDVLLAKITPCFENNKITIATLDTTHGFGSTEFHVIRPRNAALDSRYLLHFLRQDVIRDVGARRMTGSAGQKRVPRQFLSDLLIPLPPLTEQQQIAAILDQADDIRQNRRRSLEKLTQLPQAIFHEMFGNQTGDTAPSTLSSVISHDDRINYGVVQPGPEDPDGVPLIRVANLVNNDYRPASLKRISVGIESQYKRSRLRGDEILVACVGSVGAVSVASPSLSGMNIARAVARIPVDPAKANRVFIAEFLRLPHTQEYFISETRTVAQPTLNIKQLSETPILNPRRELQDLFAHRVGAVRSIENLQVQSLAKVEDLFASLQRRAFAGELCQSHVDPTLTSA